MSDIIITPFPRPAKGEAHVPGSKSISNRALMLGFLSEGEVEIRNLLQSEDTEVLQTAFKALGVPVQKGEDHTTRIRGCAGLPPRSSGELYVANAGTVARFLPASLSLLPDGDFRFAGSEAMMKRPMAGLLDCLSALGASIDFSGEPGFFPFQLHSCGWKPDELAVDASRSSQILSGLLIAATRAPHPMKFQLAGDTVSKPFVTMTTEMIRQFGGEVRFEHPFYSVSPGLTGPQNASYIVEPDASAASYFFALPIAAGGSTLIQNFPKNSLQGDLSFLDILEEVGLSVTRTGERVDVCRSHAMRSVDADFNAFSDTFLTLAALAPLLPGPTRIRGIGHTRHQETDRIAAMANELRKLGQGVEESEDSLTIQPNRERMIELTRQGPLSIKTYDDHRVAMSFAILGSHDLHGNGEPWLRILNPECCGKTFPTFFEELARMRSLTHSHS